jgi:hypothetical protein
MSGLFQRLAGRAIGQTGPRLHAQARLPFQLPPSVLSAPWVDPATPSLDIAPDTVSAGVARETDARPRVLAPDTPPAIERPSPSAAGHDVEPAPPLPPRETITSIRTSQQGAATPSFPQTQIVATKAQSPRPDLPSALPQPPIREQPHAWLLPEQAQRPAQYPERTTPALAPRVHDEVHDEVHVHIGRVEITALQDNAPSRQRGRKGPAPLSLEDYLARRNGADT